MSKGAKFNVDPERMKKPMSRQCPGDASPHLPVITLIYLYFSPSANKTFLSFFFYFKLCVPQHTDEGQRQLAGVGALLLPCGYKGLNRFT